MIRKRHYSSDLKFLLRVEVEYFCFNNSDEFPLGRERKKLHVKISIKGNKNSELCNFSMSWSRGKKKELHQNLSKLLFV